MFRVWCCLDAAQGDFYHQVVDFCTAECRTAHLSAVVLLLLFIPALELEKNQKIMGSSSAFGSAWCLGLRVEGLGFFAAWMELECKVLNYDHFLKP
jgi:hypothetical protein